MFGGALAELGGAVIGALADVVVKDDAVRYYQYLTGPNTRPVFRFCKIGVSHLM